MIGDRIKRKRLAAGMSLQDLADALESQGIKLSKAALSNYETKKTIPNARTLWALAKCFGVSLEYFLLEAKANIELSGYRKRAGLSAKRHDQIIALITDEIERRIEIEEALGFEPKIDFPKKKEIASIDEAETIARDIRSSWQLGDQPIASVSALLEGKGWYVIESPEDEDCDGLSGIVTSTGRPFVVSRTGISIDRKRLNLLHEVGHAYLHSDEDKLNEKASFRFASATLFPESKVYEEVGRKRSSFSLDELILLKKKYGLSIQAMAFRFRDLGIISDSYFSVFFAYMNQRDFKVNEPGSKELTFQEEPMAYRAQIYRAVSEGLLSEKDAARFIPGFHVGPQTASLGTLSEIRKLLSIPKEEREKVLDAAAAAALDDYRNPDLNISEVVDDIKEYP